MLFTKASEYALMAVVAIAKSQGPRDVLSLSNDLKLSRSFLAKVLQTLAKAGILVSYKGAGGGFELSRPANEVAVVELVRAVDGNSATVFACSAAVCNCPSGESKSALCSIWPFLNRLQGKIDDVLAQTTIEDLIHD
ncbi:MAG: Rrf2 family transcriptional regulator [Campylobacterales bacterium]